MYKQQAEAGDSFFYLLFLLKQRMLIRTLPEWLPWLYYTLRDALFLFMFSFLFFLQKCRIRSRDFKSLTIPKRQLLTCVTFLH